jgi:hypothetical protein
MQDRYVGDIGDYVKLALLRALKPGRRLGVAWWRYPDESHNADGRHINYLQEPSEWRAFDPDLFDGLGRIVALGARRVSALQSAGLLPDTVFCDELIPTEGSPSQRRAMRAAWFERVRSATAQCDVVFIDPDNGLETSGFTPGAISAGKSVSLSELKALAAPGRTLIVYHHQTRRKGGHIEELQHWAERLRDAGFQRVDAVRSKSYSARAFFLLDASPDLRLRAERLTEHGNGRLSWHPDTPHTAERMN